MDKNSWVGTHQDPPVHWKTVDEQKDEKHYFRAMKLWCKLTGLFVYTSSVSYSALLSTPAHLSSLLNERDITLMH